ncbi:heme-binding protein [Mixta tenebrionis]|jgi:glc operon protein GlcG|uniref:Heme-binding protein n=1 Tax=Mixta tenebrionis TaxID=2562439 RepID=A0A506VE58_9GAMM|nr:MULTISPECIES: heme-binding protein [Mixta]QHM76904.1 hypothetical protein C7M52_02890 [Mixta theicola]TPW43696.1 heme-binding protein [Mixta tenebrionis]
MPASNSLALHKRLNDSEICRQVALFLEETEKQPSTCGLALAVMGPDGEPIAFGAHARCPALPRQLAQRKAWSALRFRRATARLALEVEAGTLRLEIFNDARLLAMPGGAPIIVDGITIGGVGVSGLPPELDVEMAERFIARLL